MLSLECNCLRSVTTSGLGVSCPLGENRPKQYLPCPAAVTGRLPEQRSSDLHLKTTAKGRKWKDVAVFSKSLIHRGLALNKS